MICRDAEFWDGVANHPEVAPHIFMGMEPTSLAPILDNPDNLPMRSEHGGLIFTAAGSFGMVRELHTLYTPEGWGREVAMNAKHFMREAFKDCQIIVTQEQEGNWRSVPPKSHGWKSVGEYCYVGMPVRLKLWMLTKEAFDASPVGRKLQCQC